MTVEYSEYLDLAIRDDKHVILVLRVTFPLPTHVVDFLRNEVIFVFLLEMCVEVVLID